MNDATTTKQTKAAKLTAEALTILDCKAQNLDGILIALGFTRVCGRCAGSGRYSFNAIDGDRCYGCGGKGHLVAKLTADVLAGARAKVEDGTLAALRTGWRAKAEAKKSLGAKETEAAAIYKTIGDAYTVGSNAARTIESTHAFVESPLFRAQHLNNEIRWDLMSRAMLDVKLGKRTDYIEIAAEFDDAIGALTILRDQWLIFAANNA